jgi:hypothetical protein
MAAFGESCRDSGHVSCLFLTLLGLAARKNDAAQQRVVEPSGRQVDLVQLSVARPDHLARLLSFFGNELPEVGGQTRKSGPAEIGDARAAAPAAKCGN